MRSTCRTFLAAILFIVAVGVSITSAQEPNTAPPPQAPPAVKPAAELPQIPLAKPDAPAVQPALTGDPSAVTVEPVAAPPAASKTVTTTTTAKHVAKKTSRKPAAKSPVDVTETLKTAAPAASVAAVEPPANVPPADVPATTAPAAAIVPPAAPALKPAGDPTSTEVTKSDRTMGLGGWILFGIGVVALFGAITVIRRRRNAQKHRSITDFSPTTAELELQPALARRP